MPVTPYWESDGVTIYYGDCLQVMPEVVQAIGENCVDMILADLPYG